jgi:pteridine reductase
MKIALVTGAAKRIGEAIAKRLLEEDYYLIAHANTSFLKLNEWARTHERKAQIIELIKADLACESGQNELVSRVKKIVKTLDLLVHNASAFSSTAFPGINRKNYRAMMAINLDAPFFITQGLLPLLKKTSHPSVINIIDAMWKRPSPKFSHYAISKAGLAILTRALACELAPDIRVNAIAPGAIMFQPFHTKEMRERTIARIPHQRLGLLEDISEAVVYLSEHAKYAAGEILVIDGGRSIAS